MMAIKGREGGRRREEKRKEGGGWREGGKGKGRGKVKSVGGHMDKLELLCTVGGNVKAATMKNSMAVSQKLNIELRITI